MDGKRDWMLVKEDPKTSPRSFPLTSRSIKIPPSNRSFSEYRRARSRNLARSPATSSPPISQNLEDSFTIGDFENSLDDVIQEEEENSTSIERRFILTEEYVRKEDTSTQDIARLYTTASKSVSKRFEKKLSDLNERIGRLEAENWTLRNERHETGKIIAEQREKLDILLSRQECLTKDLNKTMVELEDQRKITQTIKKDRDTLRQQLDTQLQKELTQYKNSEWAFYCKICDSKLFTRSLIVSEVRSSNEGTSYIVKALECEFTLGPQAVRNFPSLSKHLKVRSLYCDGCLKQIGYKFSSAEQIFDRKSDEVGGRYWIEDKYIESVENRNRSRRSLDKCLIKT